MFIDGYLYSNGTQGEVIGNLLVDYHSPANEYITPPYPNNNFKIVYNLAPNTTYRLMVKGSKVSVTGAFKLKVHVPVESIRSYAPSTISLGKNSSYNIGNEITVVPAYATNPGVTYSTSSANVAAVSNTGFITTGTIYGQSGLTVASAENPNIKIVCSVVAEPLTSSSITSALYHRNSNNLDDLAQGEHRWYKLNIALDYQRDYRLIISSSNSISLTVILYEYTTGALTLTQIGNTYYGSNITINVPLSPANKKYAVFLKANNPGNTPSVSYDFTTSDPLSIVNNLFDLGYPGYYGDFNSSFATSIGEINGYMSAVARRYEALFAGMTTTTAQGINVNVDFKVKDTSSATYYYSQIDEWKNKNHLGIDALHGGSPSFTSHSNMVSSFSSGFLNQPGHPGNRINTINYWSGHKIHYAGTRYNRAWSQVHNCYLIRRETLSDPLYRELASKSILMHELGHQYGAPDHYHNDDGPCDACAAGICSNGLGVSNPRPKTCVMYKENQDISLSTILCDGCKADIRSHLLSDHN